MLAAILIAIGVASINYKGIRMLLKAPRHDAALWGIVLPVIVHMERIPMLGRSDIVTFESTIEDLPTKGVQVYVCVANAHVRQSMQKLNIISGMMREQSSHWPHEL